MNANILVIKLYFLGDFYAVAVGIRQPQIVLQPTITTYGDIGGVFIAPLHNSFILNEFLLALHFMPKNDGVAFADGSAVSIFEAGWCFHGKIVSCCNARSKCRN